MTVEALAVNQGQSEDPNQRLYGLIREVLLNPDIPVERLKAVLDLKLEVDRRAAEELFHVAMARTQIRLRPVQADLSNPQTKSRYASYEALDRATRQHYTAEGLSLTFNTGDAPGPDDIRVLCDVLHVGGHVKTYHVDMPADGKGAKGGDVMTRTHATGSALTYGQRYLLKLIFNLAVSTSSEDDDGNRASAPVVVAPEGYADWLTDLSAVADNGRAELQRAWDASKGLFKAHLTKHQRATWEALKLRASKV